MSPIVYLLSSLALARPPAAPSSFVLEGSDAARSARVTVHCGKHEVGVASGTGRLMLDAVPVRGAARCAAHFTAPIDSWFAPVVGGNDYVCRIVDDRLFCNAWTAPPPEPEAPKPVVPKPVATVSPVPKGESGSVMLTLETDGISSWSLIECPGGTRAKAKFEDGVARFDNVPDEDCVVSLKGGRPGRYRGVRPGDDLQCAESGGVIRCIPKESKVVRVSSVAPAPVVRPALVKKTVSADQLRVRLTNPAVSSAIEVNCPNGYRARQSFVIGVATVEGMPDEACVVSFKGGTPARFHDVRGGEYLTCTLIDVRADCNRD